MSEQDLNISFSDQINEFVDRPVERLKAGIVVQTKITHAEKVYTKSTGRPAIVVTEAVVDEDGNPTSTKRQKWIMMPFRHGDVSELTREQLADYDKKINIYQQMGLDFCAAYGLITDPMPTYDRETKERLSVDGEVLDYREFIAAQKPFVLQAKKLLNDAWTQPDTLIGYTAYRTTKAKPNSDGEDFVEFDQLLKEVPVGAEVLYGSDAVSFE